MNTIEIDKIIENALYEDLKDNQDHTTLSIVPPTLKAKANIISKTNGVIAGLKIMKRVFQKVDNQLSIKLLLKDGDHIKSGDLISEIEGSCSNILMAERTALNILQRMSGIASLTNEFIRKSNNKIKIMDTRKTVPGLRILDKLAVKYGGGHNHRYGLFDMILIKDNHIDAIGSIQKAIESAINYLSKKKLTNKIPIIVETRNIKEVEIASSFDNVKRILLDNMVKIKDDKTVDTSMIDKSIKIIRKKSKDFEIEVSGNVSLETISEISKLDIDCVSVGVITHSCKVLDLSLNIEKFDK